MLSYLFYIHKTKFIITSFLKGYRKKIDPIDKEFPYFLPKRLLLGCQIWVWDLGWIRDLEKIYSGSKGQKSTESRIRNRNTAD